MRQLNRIVGIEGVAASATVTIKLPTNRRYHAVKFFTTLAGVAAAVGTVISRVRLIVNGKTIRDLSAARALMIPILNGVPAAVGELSLQFSESWRADKVDEQLTAWDMFGETSFEIQLTLTAGVDPGVTGLAIFDMGQTLIDGKVAKNIVAQREVTKNGNAGLNDFDNLPKLYPIQRILLDSAQTINSVQVTADDNTVHDTLKAQNARVLADHGLVSTAIEYPVCFDFTERIDDSLQVRNTLNLRFDLAVAAAVTAIVESRAPGFI